MISSQNFVSAAPRKKATVKRAAVNNKASTKRAATSGSTRKAVANRLASRNRKMRAPSVVNNVTETENKEIEKEEVVEETVALCPVEKVIVGRTDDNGNFAYYNGKDKCSDPENSLPYKWNNDMKSKYPRGSIKESEAYYFKCEENYVVKTVNKERVCVSVLTTCPLNVVLEKADGGFISPETLEICSLAPNSQVRLVNDGENNRGDIEDSVAYISECNENKYSAPMEKGNSDLHLQCLSCPVGWEAPVGAKSESECVDVEAEKKLAEEKKKAEEELALVEAEAKRLALLRIKKVDASSDNYTCINGWTNHWDVRSDGVLVVSKIMDKDGVIKNVIDRERFGKNKVGCPIKSTDVLTLKGIEKFEKIRSVLFESVDVRYGVFLNFRDHIRPTVGLLRYKMRASDLDNTGVKGWTDEELSKWGGYAPVIGLYYSRPSCSSLNHLCIITWDGSSYPIENFESGGANSESNLFNYFN